MENNFIESYGIFISMLQNTLSSVGYCDSDYDHKLLNQFCDSTYTENLFM